MFHIRCAPVPYLFCCCFISRSSFVLIAFANAFHVRLILSGTVFACGAFPGRLLAVLAISASYFACACPCPRGFAWLSVRCFGARVLSSISPPSYPYSGESGPLLYSFSIELTVQCDGCLIWRVGLVDGLQVGQAYGVFHQPGFGSLVPVPRSLGTQPPFATQALIWV